MSCSMEVGIFSVKPFSYFRVVPRWKLTFLVVLHRGGCLRLDTRDTAAIILGLAGNLEKNLVKTTGLTRYLRC